MQQFAAFFLSRNVETGKLRSVMQETLTKTPPSDGDFRLYLQMELERRCQKNPKYSLRAFANSLGLHNASLSLILRGKRPLTHKMIKRLGEKVDLSPEEIDQFCRLGPRSNTNVATKIFKQKYFKQISQDAFNAISEWHHDAIIELFRFPDFKSDAKWMANVLGITVSEVNIALERLERLGHIERNHLGEFVDRTGDTTVQTTEFTKGALRKLQKTILQKSLESIDECDEEFRTHSSVTLAMNKNDLPKARQMIRAFRQQLCSFLQREDIEATDLYFINVSLFPLIKKIRELH